VTLMKDLAIRVEAARELEDAARVWKSFQTAARKKHEEMLEKAFRARKAGVLMRDITATTGLSRSTLYAYFAQQEGFHLDDKTP
jgi:hypothetical protein